METSDSTSSSTAPETAAASPASKRRHVVTKSTPADLIFRACLVGVALLIVYYILRQAPQLEFEFERFQLAILVVLFYVPIVAGARMGFQEYRIRSQASERSTPIALVATACLVGFLMHGAAWLALSTIHYDTGEAFWLRWGVLTVVYFVPIGCAAHLGYQRSRRQFATGASEPAGTAVPAEPWTRQPSSNDNPYQAPQVAERAVAPIDATEAIAATGVSREYLREVAVRQRAILVCLVTYLLLLAAAWVLPLHRWGIPLFWLPYLGIAVQLTTATLLGRLAAKLDGIGIGILLGVLGLIPWISLVFLLLVNQRATKLLKRHGIDVGLMGADLNEIQAATRQQES